MCRPVGRLLIRPIKTLSLLYRQVCIAYATWHWLNFKASEVLRF
jgi:hypothetical protein